MAAGLGFKTFTTGEVLTAADTNGYLMQGVLVFASAAARTAAISSPQEGQMSYLKDTDSTEYYNGSTWVSLSTSVATSLGYAAGKNSIINGDFRFNQRGFTSNTTSGTYNFDRWLQTNSGGSFTVTPQTFTPGTAPVSGYEAINFLRGITASQSATGDYAYFSQRIEDVRTNAGNTVTISFWAKANTGTPKIGVEATQNFGSGGSPSAAVNTAAGAVTLSTSWARYSVSVAIPSISGKTIGTTATSSYLEINLWTSAGATFATRASSIGIQNFTADIWGVQVETGSSATTFQTASGTIQGELALCQRYLPTTTGIEYFGYQYNAGTQLLSVNFTVPARVSPTGITTSGTFTLFNATNGSSSVTPSFNSGGAYNGTFSTTGTGSSGTPCRVQFSANTSIVWTGCEL